MRRRQAFTLIEVVMAVAIMSIIGLSIAGASMALSNAYDNGQEYYECIQTARVTMLRLEEMVRTSLLVTDANMYGSFWLWREDTNGDGRINVSELSWIMWNAQKRELYHNRVEFPDYWSSYMADMHDTVVDVNQATSENIVMFVYGSYGTYLSKTVLADDVTNFNVAASPEAPLAKTVTITMTIMRGGREITLRSAASLRADRTDHVAWVPDGYWGPGYWTLVD